MVSYLTNSIRLGRDLGIATENFVGDSIATLTYEVQNTITDLAYNGCMIGRSVTNGVYGTGVHTVQFLYNRIFKVSDRTLRFTNSCVFVARDLSARTGFTSYIENKHPELIGLLTVLKNMTDVTTSVSTEVIEAVAARNITDRADKYQEDYARNSWRVGFNPNDKGLKKLSWTVLLIGNVFETTKYLSKIGFTGYVAQLPTVVQLGSYAVTAVGTVPLLGVAGGYVVNTVGNVNLKLAKDIFVGASFSLSVIETIRFVAADTYAINQAQHNGYYAAFLTTLGRVETQKAIWTAAEHFGKVTLIVAANVLTAYAGTPAFFVYHVGLVNLVGFAKCARWDVWDRYHP